MQSKSQSENFIRGAFLITLAQFVARLMGAVYRPVAQVFIGDRGLALVTPPNSAYFIIMAVSSIGLNVAISRLISDRLAVEDYRGAKRVLHVATGLLIISGLVGSVAFALSARWLANIIGMPEAYPGFLILSPPLFLVSLVSVFRGLYQGMQRMGPSAMSQVIEQIGRVGVGLVAVAMLSRVAVNYGAAGFNSGNALGVLLAVIYGGWVYLKQRPTADWTTVAPGIESYENESVTRLLKRILAIAVPISLIGAILPLMQFIDSLYVTNRLVEIGVNADAAKEALAYLMNAGTLRDVPSILTTALYVSLVPAVTESMAAGRIDQARYRVGLSFRITFLIGIPATVGLIAGARDTYGVLFTGPGWAVMAPLAVSTIFVMVQQTTTGALQGMGLIWTTVRNLLIGVVVKAVLTYWWTAIPSLQVNGAAYATGVAFAVAAGLNLISLWRKLGLGIRVRDDVLRPVGAALIMAVAILLLHPLAHRFVHIYRFASLLVIGVAAVVYALAILALGGVTTVDLGLIPGITPGMVAALKRYRLLKD